MWVYIQLLQKWKYLCEVPKLKGWAQLQEAGNNAGDGAMIDYIYLIYWLPDAVHFILDNIRNSNL